MKTYKITQIATDTEDLTTGMYDFILSISDLVLTSVGYNNDFILASRLKRKNGIITSLNSLDEYETIMECHLRSLRRSKAEILLLDTQEISLENIEAIKSGNMYFYLGLKNPTLEALEIFKDYFNGYPDYIMIDINPINFPKTLIDFCGEKGIKIIGRNIFGDSDSFLSQWGIDYLIGFASYYCDIVCLPVKYGYERFYYMNTIAKSYISREMTEQEESNYIISKEIKFTKTTPPRVVNSFVTYKDNIINIGIPEDVIPIFGLTHTVLKKDIEFIEEKTYFSTIEIEVNTLLKELMETSNITDESEMQALARYIVIAVIKENFSVIKWLRFEYEKMGNLFIIRVQHKIFWWIKDSFILSVRKLEDGSYRIFFEEEKKKGTQNA